MINDTYNNELFCNYYAQWIEVYKRGAIRDATMAKYLNLQDTVEGVAYQRFRFMVSAIHMHRCYYLRECPLPV